MERAMVPPGQKGDASALLNQFMMAWTFMRTGWVFPEKHLYSRLTAFLEHHIEKTLGMAFKQSSDLALALHPFFKEMTDYGAAFTPIEWPETPPIAGNALLQRRIKAFVDSLGLRTAAHPLLLHLLHCQLSDKTGDRDALMRCLDTIEAYVVRRYVCGISKGEAANQRVFAKLANQMYSEGDADVASCHRRLLSALVSAEGDDRWPRDDEFAQGFRKYECSTRDAFALYVLSELEALATTGGAELGKRQLERVMPEELSPGWQETVGMDALEVHRQWCDRFANLVLLSERRNPAHTFEQVRTICSASEFETTKELGLAEKWNTYALTARADRLCQKAVARWSRPR
jgi:hypothetical protein